MKILANINGLYKSIRALKYLNVYKKNILRARKNHRLKEEHDYIKYANSQWGRKFAKDLNITLVESGRENLPTNGPVCFVSNHQGYMDVVCLCAVLDTLQMGFIAKDSLLKVPLYNEWIGLNRSVVINRNNPREAIKSLNKGTENMKLGFSMLIFPEGTRSQSPNMGEFKKGALKLATKPKVDIIPVTLDGTWRTFEEKGHFAPATVRVHIHPPIKTSKLSKEEEKHLPQTVKKIIEDKLLEMQKEDQ